MASKPRKSLRPSRDGIKAAADRAARRSKGEDVETPKVDLNPKIKAAATIKSDAVKSKDKAKRKRGRPSLYSKPLAKAICKMLAAGMSVRAIGRRPKMPSASLILSWGKDPSHPFSAHYARAREIGFLHMADDIVEICDDGSNDWMERVAKDGTALGWQVNGEAVARSRLRVDTRKWVLSKMLPKVYGEKAAVEHSGPGGGAILVADISKLELARWIALQLTQVDVQALTVEAA